jgi:hypothetical protein
MQVPESACLTPERAYALLSPQLRAKLPDQLPAWTALALALCALRHAVRQTDSSAGSSTEDGAGLARGAAATWRSYIEVLPEVTRGVLEWSPAQLHRIASTSLHDKADEICSAAATSWSEVADAVFEAASEGVIDKGAISESGFRCALHVSCHHELRPWHLQYNRGFIPTCCSACVASLLVAMCNLPQALKRV